MVNFTILAGGYDVFIAAYLFCSELPQPTLSLLRKSPSGPNPSWITAHPLNKSVIYAVNEVTEGAVQSFTVKDGTLSEPIANVSSGGDGPAYAAAFFTGEVAVMNYGGGNGRIVSTGPSDVLFGDVIASTTFPAPPNGTSHPHMALEFGNEVLVPDLGADTIWRLNREGDFAISGSIPQPSGSGPRHIAVLEDWLYTLHETTSTLSVQKIPDDPHGESSIIDTVSIIPPNPPAGATFAAAEILIPSPSYKFPFPYIYVSNRNTGIPDPRGDTIAIFEHVNKGRKDEGLRLIRQVYTGLDQIRGMEFGPAPHEYLIAGGARGSTGVAMLRRTEYGRNLEAVARNFEIANRTSFVWVQ